MLGKALAGIAAIAVSSYFAVAQAPDISCMPSVPGPSPSQGALGTTRRMSRPPGGSASSSRSEGNVLFDTGNNDKIIKDPTYWGAMFTALKPVNTPDVAIDTQLQKIGLKPDDIKYVVPSHLHLDHGGNVGKFPNSTIVVQRDEIQNAFWPKPAGRAHMIGDAALRSPNKDYPNARRDAARGEPRPVRRRHDRRQARVAHTTEAR